MGLEKNLRDMPNMKTIKTESSMDSPVEDVKAEVTTSMEELEIRPGERALVPYTNYECPVSGIEFTTTAIDEVNINLMRLVDARNKEVIPEVVEMLIRDLGDRAGFDTGNLGDGVMEEWKADWVELLRDKL